MLLLVWKWFKNSFYNPGYEEWLTTKEYEETF